MSKVFSLLCMYSNVCTLGLANRLTFSLTSIQNNGLAIRFGLSPKQLAQVTIYTISGLSLLLHESVHTYLHSTPAFLSPWHIIKPCSLPAVTGNKVLRPAVCLVWAPKLYVEVSRLKQTVKYQKGLQEQRKEPKNMETFKTNM